MLDVAPQLVCPLLCPWLPGSNTGKQERAAEERWRELGERILEQSEDIRKQRTDHCNYKYLQLRNGIKVVETGRPGSIGEMFTSYWFLLTLVSGDPLQFQARSDW